jgi:hypothetical protein
MLVPVPVTHPHVEHGGDPVVVLRTEAAREERRAGDEVLREHGEEAGDVERLIDLHPVHQRQVLGGGAAADEELPPAVAAADHAGHRLEVARQVPRGRRRGDPPDVARRDRLPAELPLHRARLLLRDPDPFELQGIGGQAPVRRQPGPRPEVDRFLERGISEQGDPQPIGARGQPDDLEEAAPVGLDGADRLTTLLQDDTRAEKRLRGGPVENDALHRGLLRPRGGRI